MRATLIGRSYDVENTLRRKSIDKESRAQLERFRKILELSGDRAIPLHLLEGETARPRQISPARIEAYLRARSAAIKTAKKAMDDQNDGGSGESSPTDD